MKTLNLQIAMPIFNGFDVFGFFLMAALFFMFGCFVFILNRQLKIPIWKATTLYFITVLFLLAGGRLFTISPDEWLGFFSSGQFPENGRITILGALTFGPLGLLSGKRMLGVKQSLLDSMAIPVLFTMVIQRMGCLFVGCCNGIVTNRYFGVSYAPYTTAHRFCAQNGTLDTLDSYTPALHPIPLYLLLVCVISALLIYKNKNIFKVVGSRYMAAMALFLIGRCIIEFWREPLTEGIFGYVILGLKGVQWLLLAAFSILSLTIYYREKYLNVSNHIIKVEKFNKPSFYNGLFILIFFGSLALFIQGFFTPTEKIALFLFSCISFCSFGMEYTRLYLPGYRFLPSGLAAILVVIFLPITAQVSHDSGRVNTSTYKEISFGMAAYNFNHYHEKADAHITEVNGCNGTYYNTEYTYHERYKHQLYAGAVGFSQYYDFGKSQHAFYKIYGVGGVDESYDPLERDGKKRELLMNIELAGGFDREFFGLSTKINIGRFRGVEQHTGLHLSSLTYGKPKFMVSLPNVNMRFGNLKIVYGEIRLGTNTYGLNSNTYGANPSTYPYVLSVGSGLGSDNRNYVRLSMGMGPTNPCLGFGAKYCINNDAIEIDFQRNVSIMDNSYNDSMGVYHSGKNDIDYRYYIGVTYSKKIGFKTHRN